MNTVLLAHCFGHELLTLGVAFVCGASVVAVILVFRAARRKSLPK